MNTEQAKQSTASEGTLSQRVLQALLMRPALLAEGRRRLQLAGRKDHDQALPRHCTRDVLARYCGVSARTLDKLLQIVEAAKNDPERYAGVIEQLDRAGNVDRAFGAVVFDEYKRSRAQDEIFKTIRIGKKRLGDFTAPELVWLAGFFRELGRHLDRKAVGYAYELFTSGQVRRAIKCAEASGKLPPKVFASGASRQRAKNV